MTLFSALLLESCLKWTPSSIPLEVSASALSLTASNDLKTPNLTMGSHMGTPPVYKVEFIPPTFYDWREGFPQCSKRNSPKLCRVEDAWACAISSAFEDRLCMESTDTNTLSPSISISFLRACVDTVTRFNLMRLWDWVFSNGIATTDCVSEDSSRLTCPRACDDGYALKTKRPSTFYNVGHRNPHSIKEALITEGPLSTEFALYEDFTYYGSGIYHHVKGKLLGYMSAVIVGYGTESGVDYWILRGSWGPHWGEDGYFKHIQGSGNIEDNVISFKM